MFFIQIILIVMYSRQEPAPRQWRPCVEVQMLIDVTSLSIYNLLSLYKLFCFRLNTSYAELLDF